MSSNPQGFRKDFRRNLSLGILGGGGGSGRHSAVAGYPFFESLACRGAGMEFGDVGCVRICFAFRSGAFPAHSDLKSDKALIRMNKNHVLALCGGPHSDQFSKCGIWGSLLCNELVVQCMCLEALSMTAAINPNEREAGLA